MISTPSPLSAAHMQMQMSTSGTFAQMQMSSSGAFSQSRPRRASFEGKPGVPMPPSPSAGNISSTPAAQLQQRMLRQRQLAMERRRVAGRHAAGGMAQANQLPAMSPMLKAPGWERVLGEGIEKPGSLVDQAEKAFKHSVVHHGKRDQDWRSKSGLSSVEEHRAHDAGQDAGEPTATPSPSGGVTSAATRNHLAPAIDEIDDIIDVALAEPTGAELDGAPRGNIKEVTSWNLHVEPARVVPSAAEVTPVQGTGAARADDGRRWYKPWGNRSKSNPPPSQNSGAAANNAGTGSGPPEATPISDFSTDVRGVTPPESANASQVGGLWDSPRSGGSRPRRRGSAGGRPRQRSVESDAGLDDLISEMCSPGVIAEEAVAATPPLPSPAASPSVHRTALVPQVGRSSPTPSSASFCSNCGAKFQSDAKFCSSCGTKREQAPAPAAPTPVAATPVAATPVEASVVTSIETFNAGDSAGDLDRLPVQAERSEGQKSRKRFWKPFRGAAPPANDMTSDIVTVDA